MDALVAHKELSAANHELETRELRAIAAKINQQYTEELKVINDKSDRVKELEASVQQVVNVNTL